MQPIPLDTESFELMRTAKEPMLYVDKTAYLHRLITDPQSRNFFLARPRRFGKSLMISTLEAIFQGRRELFKGLAIDETDYDWKKYPVIHLDMSFCAAAEYDHFIGSLPSEIKRGLREAGYEYDPSLFPSDNFGNATSSSSRSTSPRRSRRRRPSGSTTPNPIVPPTSPSGSSALRSTPGPTSSPTTASNVLCKGIRERVKANGGAPGVDGVTIQIIERSEGGVDGYLENLASYTSDQCVVQRYMMVRMRRARRSRSTTSFSVSSVS